MKALVLNEYKSLTFEDAPKPDLAADEVLIRVHSCGICGSDVHGFDGSSGRRIPPVIMGHEASGVIAEMGTAAEGFAIGDRVTFDSMISCRNCFFCRKGQANLCDNRRVLGVSCDDYRRNGAFAEYVNVPAHIVFNVPDDVSFDQAAMVEPVSVAVHAANITPITLGDTAVVIGAGMIGLLTVQAARASGCARVISVDLADDRLALAKKLGADETVNSGTTDAVAAILEMTGGRGADVVFEAVGATPTVKMAIDSARKGGVVTLIGNIAATIDFGLQSVVTREITVLGSCASSNDYPACLELLRAGAIRVDDMISAVVPLERGAEMFDRLYAREAGLTKVILTP